MLWARSEAVSKGPVGEGTQPPEGSSSAGSEPVGDACGCSQRSIAREAPVRRQHASAYTQFGHTDGNPHAAGHVYTTYALCELP